MVAFDDPSGYFTTLRLARSQRQGKKKERKMGTMQLSNAKDLARLKRIALDSQGLIGRAPFGKGVPGAIKAIEHLSYIQLDSISVIERAHNHIWRSRVPDFRPDQSNQLLEDAQVF